MSQSRRTGVLNLSLLFGTAVIALTLILTPMLASKSDTKVLADAPIDYDNISTGSIPNNPNAAKRYTVRRSVLQEMPGAVCIIDGDGTKAAAECLWAGHAPGSRSLPAWADTGPITTRACPSFPDDLIRGICAKQAGST